MKLILISLITFSFITNIFAKTLLLTPSLGKFEHPLYAGELIAKGKDQNIISSVTINRRYDGLLPVIEGKNYVELVIHINNQGMESFLFKPQNIKICTQGECIKAFEGYIDAYDRHYNYPVITHIDNIDISLSKFKNIIFKPNQTVTGTAFFKIDAREEAEIRSRISQIKIDLDELSDN